MNEKFLKLLRVANLVKSTLGVSNYEVYTYDDDTYSVIIRFRKSVRLDKLTNLVDNLSTLIYAEDDLVVIRIDSEE